jgi:hypothetical protein
MGFVDVSGACPNSHDGSRAIHKAYIDISAGGNARPPLTADQIKNQKSKMKK